MQDVKIIVGLFLVICWGALMLGGCTPESGYDYDHMIVLHDANGDTSAVAHVDPDGHMDIDELPDIRK